ncbi:MAG: ADP-ribosylglycohydrolase family protein, partial [Propionibacteriaceae bacterium]|nr:ADP-ribosylglycohydrolase family protein [Propionibacteriaceae bacterium]
SSVGWLFDGLDAVEHWAEISARVTHNHPEGIRGAQAAAGCLYLARTGASKDDIRAYVTDRIGYDLSRTLDQIRPTYHHMESCQDTVPQAITAFLESDGFEDAIRKAVSLGGDADTLTDITGGIAEAAYGIPEPIRDKALQRLPEDLKGVLARFWLEVAR